ncbi:sialidase family protein [Sphingobacterium paludis]|uniref:Putative neuraminidase n=1 Tax=Sphingobacterium paludis TaxID=1476465 RepID=A0A4R7D9P0_9SPHI|nr:sialidase family protein [Sphingobacterium paludis]TDS15786.1 putative neuraminidase [Sphingobacterium paludis]
MRFIVLLLTCAYQIPMLCAQEANIALKSSEFLFETGKFFAQCHASTIEETADGVLLTSWFAGTHEGSDDVRIWGARYEKGQWTEPRVWADGKLADGTQQPCWNPVLFRAPKESLLYLYYKVGPNPREWWGMVKTSHDGGKSWSAAKRLPTGILGPIKNKPLALPDGTILSPSSVEISEDRWVAHVERSTDQQQTWVAYPIDHDGKMNVIQPSIVEHTDGRLQVLCRSKEGVVATAWSTDAGKSWSALEKTDLINPNSGTDAIRVGNRFYIVYNPALPGKDWWEGRAKLRLATSTDGMHWKDVLHLEDEEKGEFSYPTIMQDSKGLIHIVYTHNRKNIKHVTIKE